MAVRLTRMGMHPLLANGGNKRKNRWLLSIEPYVGGEASMLPPNKSARPNLSFKEYQAEHLNETIYFPGKVEWGNLEVSLYDVRCGDNPIYNWINKIYDPFRGTYKPALGTDGTQNFKTNATLTLYRGDGTPLEAWTYYNAYPLKADWGELDMQDGGLTTVDVSLRYDRACYFKPTS